MNSACKEAYSIFCQHNKGSNNEKIRYVLNILKIYKDKINISEAELNFLSHYIHFTIGKENLSLYEINVLVSGISELTITNSESNNDLLNFIFFTVTRRIP